MNLFAPVQTILPELKIRAVVRGSRIRMMTAAKRLGLYSAFRACRAIFFRSNLHPRLTVHTIFLHEQTAIRQTPHILCLALCGQKPHKANEFTYGFHLFKYRLHSSFWNFQYIIISLKIPAAQHKTVFQFFQYVAPSTSTATASVANCGKACLCLSDQPILHRGSARPVLLVYMLLPNFSA